MSTTLALVASISARLLANRLAVGDTWIANLQVNAILAFDALDHNLNMRLTHARQVYFGSFWITCHAQRAIFFHHATQRIAHFIQVSLALREDRYHVTWLWEVDRFKCGGRLFTAGQRVTGMRVS